MRHLNVQEAIRLLQTHINDLQGNKDGAIELVKTTLETINKPGQLTRPRAESARTALLKALDTCDKIVDQVESSPLSDRVHLIGNYIYNLLLALTDHYPIRNANDEDPINLEKITPENCVFLSTGHEFTIVTLQTIFSQKLSAAIKNPLTNLPFNKRDHQILQFYSLSFTGLSLLEILALPPEARLFLIQHQNEPHQMFLKVRISPVCKACPHNLFHLQPFLLRE